MSRKLYWMVWLAAMLCMPALVLAGKNDGGKGGGKGGDKGGDKAPKHAAVWLVDSVGENAISLAKSDHGGTTNLIISVGTTIMVQSKQAKLADVQVGMRADFTASGGACSRIALNKYTPPVDKPKDAKGGKKK